MEVMVDKDQGWAGATDDDSAELIKRFWSLYLAATAVEEEVALGRRLTPEQY